jgi:hypothetical protein
MSLTDVAANERDVPVFADHRVSYVSSEGEGYAYTIRSGPSLAVKLHRENGNWFVRETETGIIGQGGDVLEAARDFERAVDQQLEQLERQDSVEAELAWQLEYLRARVRR